MPAPTSRRDATGFAEILDATKQAVMSAGLGASANVHVCESQPAQAPLTAVSSEQWTISWGPNWERPFGVNLDDGSEIILDGQVQVRYWLRSDTDEANLRDSMLGDPILGADGTLTRLVTAFGEDNLGNLCDSRDESPLMQPLQLTGVEMPSLRPGPWRVFTASYYCQIRQRTS